MKKEVFNCRIYVQKWICHWRQGLLLWQCWEPSQTPGEIPKRMASWWVKLLVLSVLPAPGSRYSLPALPTAPPAPRAFLPWGLAGDGSEQGSPAPGTYQHVRCAATHQQRLLKRTAIYLTTGKGYKNKFTFYSHLRVQFAHYTIQRGTNLYGTPLVETGRSWAINAPIKFVSPSC